MGVAVKGGENGPVTLLPGQAQLLHVVVALVLEVGDVHFDLDTAAQVRVLLDELVGVLDSELEGRDVALPFEKNTRVVS